MAAPAKKTHAELLTKAKEAVGQLQAKLDEVTALLDAASGLLPGDAVLVQKNLAKLNRSLIEAKDSAVRVHTRATKPMVTPNIISCGVADSKRKTFIFIRKIGTEADVYKVGQKPQQPRDAETVFQVGLPAIAKPAAGAAKPKPPAGKAGKKKGKGAKKRKVRAGAGGALCDKVHDYLDAHEGCTEDEQRKGAFKIGDAVLTAVIEGVKGVCNDFASKTPPAAPEDDDDDDQA